MFLIYLYSIVILIIIFLAHALIKDKKAPNKKNLKDLFKANAFLFSGLIFYPIILTSFTMGIICLLILAFTFMLMEKIADKVNEKNEKENVEIIIEEAGE